MNIIDKLAEEAIKDMLEAHNSHKCVCVVGDSSKQCFAGRWMYGQITSEQVVKAFGKVLRVTKEDWERTHKDYKGIWANPDTPEYVGRRYIMSTDGGPTCLLIEGYHFVIESHDPVDRGGSVMLSDKDLHFIESELTNSEDSNDTEMTRYLSESLNISLQKAQMLVALRDKYLCLMTKPGSIVNLVPRSFWE